MTGQVHKYDHSSLKKAENYILSNAFQDTSSVQIQTEMKTGNLLIQTKDSINTSIIVKRKFTAIDIDSIFRIADNKKQLMDSIINNRKSIKSIEIPESRPDSYELARLPYNLKYSLNETHAPVNFFKNLKAYYFQSPDTGKPVYFIEQDAAKISDRSTVMEISSEKPDSQLLVRNRPNPDWILLIFIVLLIVIAWLKLFYNKFFDQTLQSVFNRQLSSKVIRDHNIFSRRVALVLNLNFVFTTGMFFFLTSNYFGYNFLIHTGIVRYLFICGIITSLLLARFFITNVTGIVFNRNTLFKEYLHEILLTYKNAGIYLIPLAIGIAYITTEIKIYLIYSGLAVLLIAYVWRFFKGFQIIINKDILIFYLILYLCTLEILPVLIAYRFVTGIL